MSDTVGAYVPCFNNEDTVAAAIASLQGQSHPPAKILVIDDGSSDRSIEAATAMGVEVLAQEENLGRGAARHRAMIELETDLVVCCDATNRLDAEFVAKSLSWFEDQSIAAIFGHFGASDGQGVINRWRDRHLFKVGGKQEPQHHAPFSTYGAIVRRSAVMAVGNYDAALRRGEDAELGDRLLKGGYDIVCDPQLLVYATVSNTLPQVLERYWRWGMDYRSDRPSLKQYLQLLKYSISVLARRDLADNDPASIPISLMTPHYHLWQSLQNQDSSTPAQSHATPQQQ